MHMKNLIFEIKFTTFVYIQQFKNLLKRLFYLK